MPIGEPRAQERYNLVVPTLSARIEWRYAVVMGFLSDHEMKSDSVLLILSVKYSIISLIDSYAVITGLLSDHPKVYLIQSLSFLIQTYLEGHSSSSLLSGINIHDLPQASQVTVCHRMTDC